MANTIRMSYENLVQQSASVLRANGSASGRSPYWIANQRRSKAWRSPTGWMFDVDFNEAFRWQDGSLNRIAFLDGNYTTGAATASALQTAMNAGGIPPNALGGLSLWLSADTIAKADGGDVTAWADQSGNNRDLDTSVGTQTFIRRAINGRPAVRFDNDGYLSAAASAVQMDDLLGASGQGTIFTVAYVDVDHSGVDAIWAAASITRYNGVDGNDDAVARAWDGTADDAAVEGPFTGGWHVFLWNYDLTNVRAGLDDLDTAALQSTLSGAQTGLLSDFRLGGDGTNHHKGYVAEVIAFDSDLSEASRQRIVAYLEQKYGLSTDTTAPTYTNSYTVTYSGATGKFTVARSAGTDSVTLRHTASDARMNPDLGYDVAADDTGATSYEADDASYQSRHFLELDLGSALAHRTCMLLDHNLSSSGAVSMQEDSFGDWNGLGVVSSDFTVLSKTLSFDPPIAVRFYTSSTKRFVRILIRDIGNTDGYSEIGAWFLGDYFEPTRMHRPGHELQRQELTTVGFSDHGAPFMDEKPTVKGRRMLFRPVIDTDRIAFETMFEYVKTARQFFISYDAAVVPVDTQYCFFDAGVAIQHMDNSLELWQVVFNIVEAPL